MRLEARVAPLQAAGGNEPSCVAFRIGDQVLVVNLDKPIGRQDLAPMGHEALILPEKEYEIAPVRREV